MIDDLIRARMHEALDVEQIAPDLRSRVIHSLPGPEHARRRLDGPTVRWAGGLIAALLIVALVAGLIYTGTVLRRQIIPASPSRHALAGQGGMVSPTVGWLDTNAAGHIMRTTDGGVTWTDVTPESFIYEYLGAGVFFLDDVHAWDTELIRASPDSLPNGSSRITTYQTADGGQSWHAGSPIDVHGDVSFTRVSFLDPSHGWLLVSLATLTEGMTDELLRTANGGRTWTPVAEVKGANSSGHAAAGCVWNTLAFASTSVGWSVADCFGESSAYQQLLVTHDGGATWSPQQLPAGTGPSCPCDTPVVFDQKHVMLVVAASSPAPEHREILMSGDGGVTWATRALPSEVQLGVDFIDSDHGWTIAGSAGILSRDPTTGQFPLAGASVPLYRTDDGGRTWVPVLTSLDLDSSDGRVQGMNFVDSQNGFVERVNPNTQTTRLLKTTDGGHTWHVIGAIPGGW